MHKMAVVIAGQGTERTKDTPTSQHEHVHAWSILQEARRVR